MAYITNWRCNICRESIRSSRPTSGICGKCKKEKDDRDHREHFGALDALTIEERLRKIEEWQYEHSKLYHPGPIRCMI